MSSKQTTWKNYAPWRLNSRLVDGSNYVDNTIYNKDHDHKTWNAKENIQNHQKDNGLLLYYNQTQMSKRRPRGSQTKEREALVRVSIKWKNKAREDSMVLYLNPIEAVVVLEHG